MKNTFRHTKKLSRPLLVIFGFVSFSLPIQAQLVTPVKTGFDLAKAVIYIDSGEEILVKKSASILQQDIERVTGKKIPVVSQFEKSIRHYIIIGTTSQSPVIKALGKAGKVNLKDLHHKWEAFRVQTISGLPQQPAAKALVITGSDRRGLSYGVFELSRQMGVSPWYWWADVPVQKKPAIYINTSVIINDAPKVKYRGIFINDEAPCLSNWSKEKFGGFNHHFYEKVFELILRLKGNYLWPAMWGNAFYDDDSLNRKSADEFGIVIGTSHHEPLMRAHDEWRRYGKGKWNYDSNEVRLKEFWKFGMQRASNEKIVSVGMRGDGDEPMSRETATALLERIVKDQREIITEVTGKPAGATPQLWALYKEVQDYYDKGMRVPDDITLLLCDDNWGNIRKLPQTGEKPRNGGYGLYYHFDYVGGPRNYKWINTNPIPRIREQLYLAWEYNVRQIWIVNVGDIKPMEFPISFFLDYAWDPDKIGPADIKKYSERWAAAQFGKKLAPEISELLSGYAKFNSRRKPEMLSDNTYSFNYGEWPRVVKEYTALAEKAEKIGKQLPTEYQDAYFQLVLHPVKASANLYQLYYNVALNKQAYANKWLSANRYADKVKELYANDSLITLAYHQLNNGKWNHMMSQTHIGYTSWQQPIRQKMPMVNYVNESAAAAETDTTSISRKAKFPANTPYPVFYEQSQYVSIGADHFTKAVNSNGIRWTVLPDLGRTGSAITTYPVTAPPQQPGGNAPHTEYEFYTYSTGEFRISAFFSPTLNFHNTAAGLQYAISVDGEAPRIISINTDEKATEGGINYKWVGDNIIIKTSAHQIKQAGKHTLKFWMVNSGVVLQQLLLNFGGVLPSYLGPEETINKQLK